jgi:hypothetical protein
LRSTLAVKTPDESELMRNVPTDVPAVFFTTEPICPANAIRGEKILTVPLAGDPKVSLRV